MAFFGISALATAWTESKYVRLFVLCGVASLMLKAPRLSRKPVTLSAARWWAWLATGMPGVAWGAMLWKIGLYFAQAGAVVFGSGLAIGPFLHSGVVKEFSWLSEQQLQDAVGSCPDRAGDAGPAAQGEEDS